MTQFCDPGKVICRGEGLHFGYINNPIEFQVDTRLAGSGELMVFCDGPGRKAFCELHDNGNGTFHVDVIPQDAGEHSVYIKYNDVNVPGSPFPLRVSGASLVHLSGRGIEDGLLRGATGQFVIDTQEAGVGEVKVRVGGPKGYFQVETQKVGKKLLCRYNPQFPGMYEIQVLWSGDHVPGSPLQIYLCETEEELKHHITMSSLHGRKYRHIAGAHDDDFGSLYDGDSFRY